MLCRRWYSLSIALPVFSALMLLPFVESFAKSLVFSQTKSNAVVVSLNDEYNQYRDNSASTYAFSIPTSSQTYIEATQNPTIIPEVLEPRTVASTYLSQTSTKRI